MLTCSNCSQLVSLIPVVISRFHLYLHLAHVHQLQPWLVGSSVLLALLLITFPFLIVHLDQFFGFLKRDKSKSRRRRAQDGRDAHFLFGRRRHVELGLSNLAQSCSRSMQNAIFL